MSSYIIKDACEEWFGRHAHLRRILPSAAFELEGRAFHASPSLRISEFLAPADMEVLMLLAQYSPLPILVAHRARKRSSCTQHLQHAAQLPRT